MYEFLDRFISISSPRIRDFRGLPSKGFDGRGNYNFGISEQIILIEAADVSVAMLDDAGTGTYVDGTISTTDGTTLSTGY